MIHTVDEEHRVADHKHSYTYVQTALPPCFQKTAVESMNNHNLSIFG